jgi:putative transposase
MPRRARYAPTGCIFHVVNRGVERRRLFFEPADYQAFVRLLAKAKERWPVRILGVCIMPNHYHLLVQPVVNGALSSYIHWVQGCYACDLRAQTASKGYGHVFQQRFWSGIVFDSYHLCTTLRYVEANPREGGLVNSADEWEWSSLVMRSRGDRMLDPLPIALPVNWIEIVNAEPEPEEAD